MDESPKQLLGHCRAPLPMLPGSVEKVDDEYVRLGTAELFLAIESLAGFMEINVEEYRAKSDWAEFIKQLIDVQYPMQKKLCWLWITRTLINSALYEKFPPAEAFKLYASFHVVSK